MARIRTIKPELAAHEGLFDLEKETGLPIRFAWCMLFTVADRDGRFVWRPRTLKAQILPHDEVDFSRVLDAWVTRAFVVKYRVKGEWFGWIPTFTKHQVINNRESPSNIPAVESADLVYQPLDACSTRGSRVDDASATREVHAQVEGKEGREGKEGEVCGKDASLTRAQNGGNGAHTHTVVDSLEYEQAIQAKFPKGPNPPNWMAALLHARALVDTGLATWPELVAVTERYAAYVASGSQSVNIAAHNFFDRRKGNYWQQPWACVTANGAAGLPQPELTWRPPADDDEERTHASG
jgi:hypothetical protein